MSGIKSLEELQEKLDQMLSLDVTLCAEPNAYRASMFTKAAACKTLLWSMGLNDDDRWYITAEPGPPKLCRTAEEALALAHEGSRRRSGK